MLIAPTSYAGSTYPTATRAAGQGASGAGQQGKLSADEQATVAKLKARDKEVRQHEQAHLSASGGLATSGASFTYERGPDGVNYAVGGEVSINTSPGKTPQETLSRAERIRAAALAPADPSGQDRAVAAAAAGMAYQARAELAQQSQQGAGAAKPRQTALERHYQPVTAQPAATISTYA